MLLIARHMALILFDTKDRHHWTFGKEMHNLKKPDKQVKQKQMWRLTLIPDLLIIPRRVQTRLCSVLFMCYEYSECMQHSFLMYASEKGQNSGYIHTLLAREGLSGRCYLFLCYCKTVQVKLQKSCWYSDSIFAIFAITVNMILS